MTVRAACWYDDHRAVSIERQSSDGVCTEHPAPAACCTSARV